MLRSTALASPAIARAGGIVAHGADREIDRGVIGDIHEQDLRRAGDQASLERARALRHALFEERRERLADRAEPPHRDRRDRARERAVARVQPLRDRLAVGPGKTFLERFAERQSVKDRLRGDPARGIAGRRLRRRRTRASRGTIKGGSIWPHAPPLPNQNAIFLSMNAQNASRARRAARGIPCVQRLRRTMLACVGAYRRESQTGCFMPTNGDARKARTQQRQRTPLAG